MSTFQQQMMDTYPAPMDNATYPADPSSMYAPPTASPWALPIIRDPATGAFTPFAAALVLAILFLILASPPVFQFVAKTLSRFISSVAWIAPSGMPSSKLLLVHTLVYGILAYVALCMLTNAQQS
jgi:cobalamin synthase